MMKYLFACRSPLRRAGLAAAGLLVIGATHAQAMPLTGIFGGNAAAIKGDASLGVLSLELESLASLGCPCQGTDGKVQSNEVGQVTLPGILVTSGTTASAFGHKSASHAKTQQIATIGGVSLLGGLITADGITAEATVEATETDIKTATKGSGFTRLSIAGQAIDPKLHRNMTVALPGIGSVTLFSVTRKGDLTSNESINVAMLTVNITQTNTLGLPIGAKIQLGTAAASFERDQPKVVVYGTATVANANLAAGPVLLNELGAVGLSGVGSCKGEGKLHTNDFAGVNGGGLVSLGAGSTTAIGGPTGKKTNMAQTTATVAGVNLLGGLITASGVTAVATETTFGKTVSASTDGSFFAGLTIAGVTLPLNVPANTTIALPLLGHVVVNEQTLPVGGKGKVVVNGLHVVVDTPNLLDVPVGTEILLAHADAEAVPLAR